jgi:isochorismate synthase
VADILRYRIPGETPVNKTGRFKQMHDWSNHQGFIVSDFRLQHTYIFEESTEQGTLHFNENNLYVIDKDEYLETAAVFIREMREKNIKKAILSRINRSSFDEQKSIQLFDCLIEAYPTAFIYVISSEQFGTWIGASPELLLKVDDEKGFTVSLAGTKNITDTSPWGQKEIDEQRYVTEFIEQKLNQFPVENLHISEPAEHNAGPVKHLMTQFEFSMKKLLPANIIQALHPTPALSGFPQQEALQLISKFEKHERELYGGIIGVLTHSKSAVFVNLRCCQIQKGHANLYVGGGLTSESDPELEWLETVNKSRTLLNLIQNL